MALLRLDKYLSDCGIASRKDLRGMIKAGRVTIDGCPAHVPEQKIDPEEVSVAVDGVPLNYRKYRYFMMDKPAGILTATEDGKQSTVLDLLPLELKRLGLFPVGRLDKDTTGLLLLTNDGEFAHKVISPKSHVNKIYFATTEGDTNEADVTLFRNGIVLRDGLQCLPAELIPLGNCTCRVVVMEGKYHQVKRMLAAVGKPVITLRRLQIGQLTLPEGIRPGEFVELTKADLCKVL